MNLIRAAIMVAAAVITAAAIQLASPAGASTAVAGSVNPTDCLHCWEISPGN